MYRMMLLCSLYVSIYSAASETLVEERVIHSLQQLAFLKILEMGERRIELPHYIADAVHDLIPVFNRQRQECREKHITFGNQIKDPLHLLFKEAECPDILKDRRFMLQKNEAGPLWHRFALCAAERGISPNCITRHATPWMFAGCAFTSISCAMLAIGASGCETPSVLGLILGACVCSGSVALCGPLCNTLCLPRCAEAYYGTLFNDQGITIVPIKEKPLEEITISGPVARSMPSALMMVADSEGDDDKVNLRPAPVARSMPAALTVLSDSEGDQDEAMLLYGPEENERSDEESASEDRLLLVLP